MGFVELFGGFAIGFAAGWIVALIFSRKG